VIKRVLQLSWLETKLFLREPLTVVLSLALPLIILFVLAGVFGNEPTADGEMVVYRGVGAMSYYVPAYVALVVASVGVISIPTHLAGDRERGVLKRFHASSVSAWEVAIAQLVVALLLSAASAVLLVGVAAVVHEFDTARSWLAVAGVLVVLVVGFTAMGVFLGALMPTARAAQAVGLLVWFVMLMLGGAGPPREVLTGSMGVVADGTPLWHGVRMMHDAWLGLDAGLSWLIFGAVSAVAGLAGLRLFRWD
jgi:ABC-2 type transport system permease protein